MLFSTTSQLTNLDALESSDFKGEHVRLYMRHLTGMANKDKKPKNIKKIMQLDGSLANMYLWLKSEGIIGDDGSSRAHEPGAADGGSVAPAPVPAHVPAPAPAAPDQKQKSKPKVKKEKN